MEIEVRIDPHHKEPKLIILTSEITEEISMLIAKLSQERLEVLTGYQGESAVLLEDCHIISIYTASGKVFAATSQGEFLIRHRLYEVEN